MKEIPLSIKGNIHAGQFVALVDDDDYEWLMQWKWHVTFGPKPTHKPYAARRVFRDGKYVLLRMAREVVAAKAGMVVDHKNHNTLDNRKENLRVCTQRENMLNMNSSRGTSEFIGVCWRPDEKKWRAYLGRDTLGSFDDPVLAATVRDDAAFAARGQYANLNFPSRFKLVTEVK